MLSQSSASFCVIRKPQGYQRFLRLVNNLGMDGNLYSLPALYAIALEMKQQMIPRTNETTLSESFSRFWSHGDLILLFVQRDPIKVGLFKC